MESETLIAGLNNLNSAVLSLKRRVSIARYSDDDSIAFKERKLRQLGYLLSAIEKLKSEVYLGFFPWVKRNELNSLNEWYCFEYDQFICFFFNYREKMTLTLATECDGRLLMWCKTLRNQHSHQDMRGGFDTNERDGHMNCGCEICGPLLLVG
jgi:hypothetical protein